MWVLPCGTTTFSAGTGTLSRSAGITSFGTTPVSAIGVFMDFDGRPQPGPDINTRGMLVTGRDRAVSRYFVDPYPVLTGASPGAAAGQAVVAESPAGAAALLAAPALAAAAVLGRRRTRQTRR